MPRKSNPQSAQQDRVLKRLRLGNYGFVLLFAGLFIVSILTIIDTSRLTQLNREHLMQNTARLQTDNNIIAALCTNLTLRYDAFEKHNDAIRRENADYMHKLSQYNNAVIAIHLQYLMHVQHIEDTYANETAPSADSMCKKEKK